MRKLFLLTTFLLATPIILVANILFLISISSQKKHSTLGISTQRQPVIYAALPTIQNTFDVEITQEDARIEIIRQFFARYGSPLEPFAKDIVFYADQYGLDFRITPAIAMQESNLCLKAPVGSNNCWGYGIYGGKIRTFDTYTEGIHQVTKSLATTYKNNGLDTPEQIMTRYTPSSKGRWANGVVYFMNQLQ